MTNRNLNQPLDEVDALHGLVWLAANDWAPAGAGEIRWLYADTEQRLGTLPCVPGEPPAPGLGNKARLVGLLAADRWSVTTLTVGTDELLSRVWPRAMGDWPPPAAAAETRRFPLTEAGFVAWLRARPQAMPLH